MIEFQIAGQTQNLTPSETYQAAQYGLMKLMDESKPKDESKEESKEEENSELSLESLQGQIQTLKGELVEKDKKEQNERSLTQINQRVNLQQSKYDSTKEDKDLHESVAIETLARINFNPRLTIEDVYKSVLEKRTSFIDKGVESEKERLKNNSSIFNRLNSVQRGGGSPVVDKKKVFTAEDLRTNVSRRALAERLNAESRGDF